MSFGIICSSVVTRRVASTGRPIFAKIWSCCVSCRSSWSRSSSRCRSFSLSERSVWRDFSSTSRACTFRCTSSIHSPSPQTRISVIHAWSPTMRLRWRTLGYQSGRNSSSRTGGLLRLLLLHARDAGGDRRGRGFELAPARVAGDGFDHLGNVDDFRRRHRVGQRRVARLTVARGELALGQLEAQPERGGPLGHVAHPL